MEFGERCKQRFLAHDASSRYCHDVRPSVCLSVCMEGVCRDHTVLVRVNLSLWLDSSMFWAP